MAKCEEVIRVRGENIEVGREVCLRKKMNDKKEKGNKKTCRERRQKKKDKTMGTFPLSEILSGKKDKNFGETYSVVLKTSLYVSKNVTICFHKFFWTISKCSIITIVMFFKNVAINKKYTTKTVLFAAF